MSRRGSKSKIRDRLTTIQKEKRKKKEIICVGDKVALDNDKEGYVHFVGPVQTTGKGLVLQYGIELGRNEGVSDGFFFNRQYFFPKNKRSAIITERKHIISIIRKINGKRLTIGDKVKVKGRGNGNIKFIGPTLFGPHVWFGIQLDKKAGRNNGMVQGIRYFECQPYHGLFCREDKLIPLDKHGNPKTLAGSYKKKSSKEMAVDLFEACAKGDLKTVRAILSIDKTVAREAVDPNTEASALMTACYHGYFLIVNELLSTKLIDVNEQNYHGLNALHFAAQSGFENIVELLIKHKIDIDMRTEDGITALYIAVEKGHEDVVEKLLAHFADVNLSSRDDESPLIQACHRGHESIVKRLLQAPNIKVNQKRKTDGATALFVACREGSIECVKHLLANIQIGVNESKTNGRSPLFIASFFGHYEIVKLLIEHSEKMDDRGIEHGVIDVNQADSKGFTPLFVAAQNGHTKIVRLLLENGADVNQAEQRGHTPLWISALRGHVDVVRVLLAHPNIDIDFKDLSGVTALWAACQNNNTDVVELLLHPRDLEAKVEIQQGHKRVVSLQLSKGLDLLIGVDDLNDDEEIKTNENDWGFSEYENTRQKRRNNRNNNNNNDDENDEENKDNSENDDKHKRKRSHKRTSSRLLWKKKGERKGADPNLAKHDGCTPLWIAASRGNSECMGHLIAYGADLNMPDRSQGATPLFVACQNGKKNSVDLLLAAGADVNKPRNGDGTTPLMMSAHNGHSDIVAVLLQSGADPLLSNSTGLNALGCAAMQGHAKIVKLCYQYLLRVKSQENIRRFVNQGDQVNGWTPLHLACMGGHSRVIKYLIEKVKVDIFKKDYENKTGLEHAWQNGHQNIVSWLSALEHQYSQQRIS